MTTRFYEKMLILKICLVSNNFDIAKEPVVNDLVDVACNLEFTVKKRDSFFVSQCKSSVFLFVFLLSFFFGQRTDDIQNCFYVYIHPKNSIYKGIVTMKNLSLIELITYGEHCFNVAFTFPSFRENI